MTKLPTPEELREIRKVKETNLDQMGLTEHLSYLIGFVTKLIESEPEQDWFSSKKAVELNGENVKIDIFKYIVAKNGLLCDPQYESTDVLLYEELFKDSQVEASYTNELRLFVSPELTGCYLYEVHIDLGFIYLEKAFVINASGDVIQSKQGRIFFDPETDLEA